MLEKERLDKPEVVKREVIKERGNTSEKKKVVNKQKAHIR